MTDEKSRDNYLTRVYGITLAEYTEALAAQGGGCAVCGKKPGLRSLHVDHSHRVPRIVRGILCWRCNKLLGVAGDNAALLRSAAAYLDAPPFVQLFGTRIVIPQKKRRKKKR